MLSLKNEKIIVSFDEKTGFVTEIINTQDKHRMNWVLPDAKWGSVDGFDIQSVEYLDNKVLVNAIGNAIDCRGLSLTIERILTDNGYLEKYKFKNETKTDYFITQETFGISFSFASIFLSERSIEEQIYENCVAHVWCGYNSCWICGKKIDGSGDKLFINMVSGDIADYSIDRDISKAKGSDARGNIVLNPTPFILDEGEECTFAFEYIFTNDKLENVLSMQKDFIYVYADTYSQFIGKSINFTAEYNGKIEKAIVECDGQNVDFSIENNKIKWITTSDVFGEKRLDIYINEKHTIAKVNFIEDLDVILEKRANFIAKNQQYIKEGSHLDGAYLIYDDIAKRQFYSDRFYDRNAGRERIAMGVIVLKQLQRKKDAFLMESIEKHRAFVERELFDINDGTTFNQICRDNAWNRIFNYPWFSVYFKEWYTLTGNPEFLKRAALSLIGYYTITDYKYDGQLAESYEIINMLQKEKMNELSDKIRMFVLKTADNYSKKKCSSIANECAYVQECPNNRCVYASQAYLLSKDEKYLLEAKRQKTISEAFYSCQPDYHMNGISVRNWDRYWFGKKRQYGDLYPHYWSALMGWMYGWYGKASGEDYKQIRDEILKNNLCVYRNDGFASNNYLYPYKVTLYSSNPEHNDEDRPTGSYYGKCYDEWSNDQDWALYLADYFMNGDFE